MRIYGLLGRNISYSVSPLMHNAAFRHFGIDAVYRLFDVDENGLREFFSGFERDPDFAGMNVTVPYKMNVMDIVKRKAGARLDKWAEVIGALNTLKKTDNTITGFNTDAPGFFDSLRDDTSFEPAGKKVLVFGAGGAGRAVSLYLAGSAGLGKLSVFDTDKSKLDSLESDMIDSGFVVKDSFSVVSDGAVLPELIRGADLVVNATPLGTKEGDPSPFDTGLLRKGLTVYDLVYARETELLKAARSKGLSCADGLGMLINQAAIAFDIWTGAGAADVKPIMKKAIKERFGG
jgi:shikimate dehydrogenase